MKNQFYILVCILFISCDFLGLQKKDIPVRKPIASVHNNNLYTEDIKLLIPKNIEKNDSLVFTRYIILTYLSYKNKTSLYDSLKRCRKQKKFIDYGLRLLNFFLKKIITVIEYVIELLQRGKQEKAENILRTIIMSSNRFDDMISTPI